MLLTRQSAGVCCGSRPQVASFQAPHRPARSALCVRASAQENGPVAEPARRQMLLGFAGLSLASGFAGFSSVARADVEYTAFKGMATPPTSYGGYGGNDPKATAKYTFQYPADWKEDKISKVEKGTQGVDGRVSNPKVKNMSAFVVTLGRAGEDNKSFMLKDLDQTFQGFAGADYNLQDSMMNANEIKKSQHEDEATGNTFYDYDIDSPEFRYLASIAVKQGKVFALFVRSPARSFNANQEKLRHIIDTFQLL